MPLSDIPNYQHFWLHNIFFTEFGNEHLYKKYSVVQLRTWHTYSVHCLFLKEDLVFGGLNHISNECTNLIKCSNNRMCIAQKENLLVLHFLKLIRFPKETIKIWCFLFYYLINVHFCVHIYVTLGLLMVLRFPSSPVLGYSPMSYNTYQVPKE